ncbi:CPBP family intramembrane glutamic endopeptidase [Reticulibacter mediterranei]|uniref:CPBP family intramembrane glutamic endopeptidase n=1 Tax=Reticulibacter mediterranei TaxID=2778369 RepID=UPI0022A8360E|nr:CPBP family intramembrane glutamic endopeptidase [Reticulibacter mediterranei]
MYDKFLCCTTQSSEETAPARFVFFSPSIVHALYTILSFLLCLERLHFGGPAGKEPGWRGFALPKLQDRYSALGANLILGVLWTVWHLPFYFIPGTSQSTTPFFVFALGTLANSILFTWVYNHTRGSVLMTFLFHNALNITALYLPLSLWDQWQGVAAQCLVALVVVIAAGPARLSRRSSSGQPPSSGLYPKTDRLERAKDSM